MSHDRDTGAGDSGINETASRTPPGLVFRWAITGTLGVLLVLLAGYGVYLVRSILVLVVIALFLAISLEPVVRWLMRWKMPRPTAVAVVFLMVVLLFAGFMWSVAPPIIDQGSKLFTNLPGYLEKLSDESRAVREITDRYHLTERLSGVVAEMPAKLAGGAVGFFRQVVGTVASTLTVFVLTVYFMGDLHRMQRGLIRLFPARRRERAGEIVDVVVDKVGGYMIGNITISIFAGATSFICLELVGVPFALPLAVTVAITDLIPMIGATLGATMCVLVSLFTVGLWPQTVIVLLFFILYQQVENYLLVPRVYRNTVDMPSVVVLLVAMVGGSLLGLVGVIMAIPIAATVKVAMSPIMARLDQLPPGAEGGRQS
jgi:predicted PurR-regulated permease PerM